MQILFLFCFFLEPLFIVFVKCETSKVRVQIENGQIIGETFNVGRSRFVHRFLGIPYAEPPIGELRFRKTKALEKNWSVPFSATNWPPMCIQNPYFIANPPDKNMFNNNATSEDCLFINLWTPSIQKIKSKLRPVIVWIHGGALFLGTSSKSLYDGKTLSNMADAVVVTFNYRLSALGFLYSDKVANIKGNQGLWDQAMALKWIQNNIDKFGGDPKRVTIIGQSAGSWSVSALILSPITRNLFQNAFMMSGAVDERVAASKEHMVKLFLKGIRKLKCATEEQTSITQEVIDCINKLKLEQIDQIVHLMYDQKLMFPPLLTIDGEFLTDSTMEMIKQRNYKTDLNLIVTFVENEGSFLLKYLPQFSSINADSFSLKEAKSFLDTFLNKQIFVGKTKVDIEKLSKLYFNGLTKLHDQDLFRNPVSIAYGDLLFICPELNFAQSIKLHSPEATVFQLFYRLHTGQSRPICPKWSKACHTDDIYSLFGMPFQKPDQYTQRERDVSAEYINFLSEFIRTGKPNTKRPQWQEYFILNNETVVSPYYELTNSVTTHNNYKLNLKQFECQFLSQYI